MILDVGSGVPSRYHEYFERANTIHIDIERTAINVDVVCDAHSLPFKAGSFNIAYASHILEHLENPTKAIKEIKRVASYAIIKVPNASHYAWKSSGEEHLFSWNQYTLHNFLARFFSTVKILSTNRILGNRTRKILSFALTLFHGKNELTAICRVA